MSFPSSTLEARPTIEKRSPNLPTHYIWRSCREFGFLVPSSTCRNSRDSLHKCNQTSVHRSIEPLSATVPRYLTNPAWKNPQSPFVNLECAQVRGLMLKSHPVFRSQKGWLRRISI